MRWRVRRWLWNRPATRRARALGRRFGLPPKPGETARMYRRRVNAFYRASAGWPPFR